MHHRPSLGIALALLLGAGLTPALCRAQPAGTPAPGPKLAPPATGETLPRPRDVKESGSKALQKPAPNLKAPPLEPTDVPLPINLAAALRLSDARPILIAAAQASVWVAEARMQRAAVLWLPTLNLGFDYTRHDGYGPDFNRGLNTAARPLNQNINFFYAGAGLTQQVALTDAIFAPLAARQTVNARRWDIQTAKNDALYKTAAAYFNVHRARGMYAGALDTVDRGKKLVARLTELSKDLIPRVEVDRALRMLADLEQGAASARQDWRVASADLTQVLRLDPRAVAIPLEADHLQLSLFEPSRPLDELLPIALTNRPELASQQDMVKATLVRIRQEKLRPLLPTALMNGFQTPAELIMFGAQGIGSGGKLNLWSYRNDISPQVLWQIEGLGLGNYARIKEQRGEQSRAVVELFRIQDLVAADVTRAQARLQSAAVRVVQADRSLREALITYEGNYEGLRQTTRFGNLLVQVYRPQEAVVALENVKRSYDLYFTTIADYNRSQFQLFHALGYPAREIAYLRTPGEPAPVDTTRPALLPPVGIGPPPASR